MNQERKLSNSLLCLRVLYMIISVSKHYLQACFQIFGNGRRELGAAYLPSLLYYLKKFLDMFLT